MLHQLLKGQPGKQPFRPFHFSMIEHFFEPLESIFIANGSGVDSVNLVMSDFAGSKGYSDRRNPIDRVEGLYHLIHGVNNATRVNLGCGGYYNIIYVNGREKDNMSRLKEISDHRAKLASEVVHTSAVGLITMDDTFQILENLIFNEAGFEEMEEKFWTKVADPVKVFKFLRGYKGAAYYLPK